jgi:hypothetical protein
MVLMERILLTLTSSESKRLIGKAVAILPEVKAALENGIIFIATSTSSAYVAEELLDITIANKGLFTAGVVVPRGFCITSPDQRHSLQYGYIGVAQGVVSTNLTRAELIEQWLPLMDHDDVFIKGVNAIDSTGLAAIALGRGGRTRGGGGTIGSVIGAVTCRGIQLILPASLEKLVPGSLINVASTVGGPFKYAAGIPSGMMTVKGKLMTETQAFQVLTGATATPIAAGGVDGAEGAHTFIVEGTTDDVEQAWTLYKIVKGEPPITTVTMNCDDCQMGCSFHNNPNLIALRNTQSNLKGHMQSNS